MRTPGHAGTHPSPSRNPRRNTGGVVLSARAPDSVVTRYAIFDTRRVYPPAHSPHCQGREGARGAARPSVM